MSTPTRETMSVPRVPTGFLLTTLEYNVAEATEWSEHRHGHHELIWSASGIVTLEAGGRVWAIPPTLGVWIPAGIPHRAAAAGAAEVRATYLIDVASNMSGMPQVPTGVALSEPLRILLMHNLQASITPEARLRVQRVILDMLAPAPRESFELNMPRSTHLRHVAHAVLSDPASKRTTADWALAIGMHPRTLARQFSTETGMTFTQWRILARLQLAIRELANGEAVVTVSRRLGYKNPSTFIEHFRTLTGQTPAEYTRGRATAAFG